MYNTKTGEEFVNNTHPAVGIFSNRSPALDLHNDLFIFPAVARESGGKIVAIDSNTGKKKWTHDFDTRAQTAPIVVTHNAGTEIWAGSSGGYLVSINPTDGFRNWIRKMSEFFRMDDYAWGISGEISAAIPFYLISSEEGIRGGWLADYVEYEAVALDPGIPEGEEAIPGKTYNGTATFKYAEGGIWDIMPPDVGVFYGYQYLKLTYPDGREVENEDGTVYEPPMKKGEDITLSFSWTAGSSDTITALINLDQEPVKKWFDETNFDNNKITVTIPIDLQNLVAEITSYPVEALAGDNETVTGQIINEGDVPINTTVRWSINGDTVYEGPVTVDKTKELSLPFTMPDKDVTVELEVNPNRNQPLDESSWADNKDNVTIAVAVAPPQGSANLILTPNPAKWWEMVTATLKPSAPSPPKGTLTSWSITSTKLTYPKKHPEWTFGHPLDPVGTITTNMSTGGHTSTVEFREDWSNYGADVYDVIDGRHILSPTYYPISVEYKINYTYKYKVRKATGSGENRRWRTVTRTRSDTESGSASAQILVDGTSRVPKAN